MAEKQHATKNARLIPETKSETREAGNRELELYSEPTGRREAISPPMIAIPIDWADCRIVPIIPDAAPNFSGITELITEFRFGEEKNPCPIPMRTSGITIASTEDFGPKKLKMKNATDLSPIPNELKYLADTRSDSTPAIGEVITMQTVWAIMTSPVENGENPRTV